MSPGRRAPSPDEPRLHLAWFAVVALLALLAYARSFTASFQFDDYAVLVAEENGRLSSWTDFLSFARARTVPFASLAANYWVGGRNPLGYHVVNMMVHLLATFLVYELALALCRTPRLRATWLAQERLPFAVAAAAVFACHPIEVQAVTYVVQRVSSMAAMFYVGSVLAYVRARNAELGARPDRAATAYAGSLLLALGAFLSKENTASLPLAIMLAEVTFFGVKGVPKQLRRIAPFVVLMLVIPFMWKLLAIGPRRLPDGSEVPAEPLTAFLRLLVFRANPTADISPLEYLFTQAVVIPRYLRLVILPWGLNVDHDIAVERSFSAAVASGFAFLALLLAFGVYAVRHWPVLGFAILWLFVALSVESSILPIHDVMVEHRMYLAMPGIALAAGNGFAWFFRLRRSTALIAGTAALLLLGALTFMRNEVWRTHESLWSDALAKSPRKPRVYVNLGQALYLAGRVDEAISRYCQALALDPQYVQARVNLDAAVEKQADAGFDSEDEIVLEEMHTGPPGSAVVLRPPDPCRGR